MILLYILLNIVCFKAYFILTNVKLIDVKFIFYLAYAL